MGARILKIEPSSKALPWFKVLFIVPLSFIVSAQNLSAADAERQPLLVNEHPRGDVERGLHQNHGRATSVTDDVPLPDIQFDAALLTVVNPLNLEEIPINGELLAKVLVTPAQNEMNKIIQYLAFISPTSTQGRIAQIIGKAKEDGIYVDDMEQFRKVLFERAWSAATTGPLANILKDLNAKTKALQLVAPALGGQNVQLRAENARLVLVVGGLQNVVQLFQDRKRQLEQLVGDKIAEVTRIKQEDARNSAAQEARIKQLERKNWWLFWVAVPTVSVTMGVVGALVAHFWWR